MAYDSLIGLVKTIPTSFTSFLGEIALYQEIAQLTTLLEQFAALDTEVALANMEYTDYAKELLEHDVTKVLP
jgi:hypothetical protein